MLERHAPLQSYKLNYITSTRSMQGVTKTAKDRVMVGLKGHKKVLKQSLKKIELHALLMSHQHKHAREEKEGQPPPIWGLKTRFPPLKFL